MPVQGAGNRDRPQGHQGDADCSRRRICVRMFGRSEGSRHQRDKQPEPRNDETERNNGKAGANPRQQGAFGGKKYAGIGHSARYPIAILCARLCGSDAALCRLLHPKPGTETDSFQYIRPLEMVYIFTASSVRTLSSIPFDPPPIQRWVQYNADRAGAYISWPMHGDGEQGVRLTELS